MTSGNDDDEYDEDSLIDEIRRKDERIRELEAQLASVSPGQSDTVRLEDLMIDPMKKLAEYKIRMEPRSSNVVGEPEGVFFKFTKRQTDVAFSMGCDLQTAEHIAFTLLTIIQQEKTRLAQKLAEIEPINDDF